MGLPARVSAGALSGAHQQQQQHPVAPGPSLSDMLKPDELVPLLSSEGIAESLFEFLPEEHRSAHQVVELAHSPQFQQQVARMGVSSASLVRTRSCNHMPVVIVTKMPLFMCSRRTLTDILCGHDKIVLRTHQVARLVGPQPQGI